jgi:hypothetical protein
MGRNQKYHYRYANGMNFEKYWSFGEKEKEVIAHGTYLLFEDNKFVFVWFQL